MARHQHQHPLIRYSLPATVTLLVVTALMPVRYLDWVGWFGGLAATVFTPISDPMVWVARWLAPASRVHEDDDRIVTLEHDRDELKRRLLVARQRVDELEEQLADLEAGSRRAPDVAVLQLTRPVVGASSDPSSGLLRVKAGRRDGITAHSTITTVRGVQLHGQVVSVDRLECIVMPITEPESGLLRGRVLLDGAGETSLLCQLAPTGMGTFRGDVEYPDPKPGEAKPPELEPGMEVVLDDPAWPESAQMFTIGLIERVEPDKEQPLRSNIVVRPRDGLDLRRVREVILRVPLTPGEDGP
ncbi:MAG: hypothetical protein H6810_05635 [Phycisphaeraceae bacterium]|nr:MAG: hypothetical protein H6810_05635 [Phycisphaeraceae bacterium]